MGASIDGVLLSQSFDLQTLDRRSSLTVNIHLTPFPALVAVAAVDNRSPVLHSDEMGNVASVTANVTQRYPVRSEPRAGVNSDLLETTEVQRVTGASSAIPGALEIRVSAVDPCP